MPAPDVLERQVNVGVQCDVDVGVVESLEARIRELEAREAMWSARVRRAEEEKGRWQLACEAMGGVVISREVERAGLVLLK
ncbi:hypothetical protein HK101_002256 [Irineochytrium annulatum]|nr:hypothetical protein HK101_002256 [Irineochytrium annulatum]